MFACWRSFVRAQEVQNCRVDAVPLIIGSTEDASTLATSILGCSDGAFAVQWVGEVFVEETIHVTRGTSRHHWGWTRSSCKWRQEYAAVQLGRGVDLAPIGPDACARQRFYRRRRGYLCGPVYRFVYRKHVVHLQLRWFLWGCNLLAKFHGVLGWRRDRIHQQLRWFPWRCNLRAKFIGVLGCLSPTLLA